MGKALSHARMADSSYWLAGSFSATCHVITICCVMCFDRFSELVDTRTLERVHLSIARGRPFGDDSWTAKMAKRHGLASSLRDPWRPRKTVKKET